MTHDVIPATAAVGGRPDICSQRVYREAICSRALQPHTRSGRLWRDSQRVCAIKRPCDRLCQRQRSVEQAGGCQLDIRFSQTRRFNRGLR
jgi:hypothetical protein